MAMDSTGGQFALDLQGLQRLKQTASSRPEEGVREAAKQFEAVFLKMMLKSMRDATPQSGLLDSQQTRFYTEMLDQQWSQHLSGQGVGLAEQLVQQLEDRGLVPKVDSASESLIAGIPRGTPRVLHGGLQGDVPVASQAADAPTEEPVTRFLDALELKPAGSGYESAARGATEPTGSTDRERPAHVAEFLRELHGPAQAASRTTGVPAELILAQAALETGWGRHEIPTADGNNSHNLFGIKAGSQWQGETTDITTTEYVDGRAVKMVDRFRVYDDFEAAFTDYARLIGDNPRYAGVVTASNASNAARALQAGGYATDPAYADKLIAIMDTLGLRGADETQLASNEARPVNNARAKLEAYAIDRLPTQIF
ncbi:flagellar assembly peptidoglycan hydrolase FlgJ [Halomonas sp. HP20-15]|uniref:flagellar assembly peptidoglycan hydrolase FlgJ n=1 Tax=Halomonas sp. HP20-15 TaxID=3085901 RepID=UPI002981CE3E|nr:flagellar assembly peptidoglycan hydrolase FlgJ [Halomonas sp. HP20-15]MDW5375310.1 flagellar assembly peptidoglycan hydrolase FlgJ [Halomonas sp. HP20-15]